MIYLNKNTENDVIIELTLNSTLENPNYLFEFINDTTQQVTYFTSPDLSEYKQRYNHFQITETGTTYVDLTASTVNLLSGSYKYNIYESSNETLEVSATTSIVNTGKAYVNGIDTELDKIYR